MNTKGLLLICFGILLNMTVFFVWQADAANDTEETFSLERELLANAEADNPPSTGWINIVEEEYLIIDDSQYAITKDTAFLVKKSQLGYGVFVSFRTDAEDNLLDIGIAEPTEEDMDRKPYDQSGFAGASDANRDAAEPQREDTLRYEDGKWVN